MRASLIDTDFFRRGAHFPSNALPARTLGEPEGRGRQRAARLAQLQRPRQPWQLEVTA
jgi:hypothetical protein